MTNFGGYKVFCPRLTKYCRGRVPGGVDAPESNLVLFCMLALADVYTFECVFTALASVIKYVNM